MDFTAQIKALPKARPRVTRNGAYMPTKYTRYKRELALIARHYLTKLDGDVELVCRFTFENKVHGDLDNLVGGVMDSLNGLAYHDDKQVKFLSASIEFGDAPSVYVSIQGIK